MFRQAKLSAILAASVLFGCERSAETGGRESVADFYRGNVVRIIVGFSPGGGYDSAARVLARHIGKHIPGNPRVIVENQPGAGSLVAANIMNTAKDGSRIGIFSDTIPFTPIWSSEEMQFDARTIGWLGALVSRGTTMLLVRSDAPATTLEGVRQTEITVGATGPDSSTSSYARLANEMLGTKLKPVLGYAGSTEVYFAMERGEVHGRASSSWENVTRLYPDWFKTGFVKPVVILSLEGHPDMPNVPLAIDHARSEEDRDVMRLVFGVQQFGRIFLMPAGIPPERLAAMRRAFRDTMADPAFLADVKNSVREDLNVSYHDAIEKFVQDAYAFPESVRKRAGQYIAADD